jgi:hypothetical protein
MIDELYVLEKIIKPCRKGKFIYVVCSSQKNYKEIKRQLKEFKIPNKRGIYTWRGIIIIGINRVTEYEKYFDIILELNK